MPTSNILCHLLVDSCWILFENDIHCWWQSKVRLFQHTSQCLSHNLIIAEFEDGPSNGWSYKNAIYQDCKKYEIVMLSPESYDCCPRTSWGKFNGSICFSCVTSFPAFTNYSLPENYGKVKISRIYQDVVFARRESLLNCVINSSGLTERGGEIAKVDIGQHECEFQKKVALFSQAHFHLSHLRSFS